MWQIRQNLLVIFRPICEVVTTSKIRQNLLVIFDQSAIFQTICDVAATSEISQNQLLIFLSHLRRRNDHTDSSKFISYFRIICNIAATLQIHKNSLIIFWTISDVADLSKFTGHFSTDLRCFCRFVKIYLSFFDQRSDVAYSSRFIDHFSTNSLSSLRRRRFVKIYWLFFVAVSS